MAKRLPTAKYAAAAVPVAIGGLAGTAPAAAAHASPATAASNDYSFPVKGPHGYGGSDARYGAPRSDHTHQGQDVSAPAGTQLVAAKGGRVLYKGYQANRGGNYLVIAGSDGRDYVYMHMLRPASVSQGQAVGTGTPIGQVGSTGESSGPHLHFEMWTHPWQKGGHSFDPRPYLMQWDHRRGR